MDTNDTSVTMFEEKLDPLVKALADNIVELKLASKQDGFKKILDVIYGEDIQETITTMKRIFGGVYDFIAVQPTPASRCKVYNLAYSRQEDNKMTLEVLASDVEVEDRDLYAAWTLEAHNDLFNSLFKIDIEQELGQAIREEIIAEHVANILHKVSDLAESNKREFDVKSDKFGPALLIEINRLCTDIAVRTRRGSGNRIVFSPMTYKYFQKALEDSGLRRFEECSEEQHPRSKMKKVGVYNGTINVYVSEFCPDQILVGYKGGSGECDAGLFHVPYSWVTPGEVKINDITFEPVQSFLTTENFHVTEGAFCDGSDYYGKIILTNMDEEEKDV